MGKENGNSIFSYKVTSHVDRIVTVEAKDKAEADRLILQALEDGRRIIIGTFSKLNDGDCSMPVFAGKDDHVENVPTELSRAFKPDIVGVEPEKK